MDTQSPLGFWNIAAQDPGRLALVDPDGVAYDYEELDRRANRTANGLRALGLSRGDGLSVVVPNCVEFIELYLASMQIGLYLTCINFHLTGPEIAYIVNDSGSKALVVSQRYSSAAVAATADISIPSTHRFSLGAIEGFSPYGEMTGGQPTTPPTDRSPGAAMLYTSGTTGRPKGVRRPLPGGDPNDVATASSLLSTLFDIAPGPGAHLVAGPLYHAAPLAFGTGALNLGQTVVLMDKWSPQDTLRLIERWRITTSHMVPTMFHRLLSLPADVRSSCEVSSLQSVIHAAAPCPVEVKRRMIEWWGPVIYEYYAATEGGGTYVKPKDWLEHPGTVGQPFPGATVKILDDDGNELPAGQVGTVYMGTPSGTFEYYKDPEKTKSARRHGLFTVGDMGYLDPDGWLYLSDRKADMIISGGVNIYPAEIEATLLEHPDVEDAAVFGIPDDDWGEQVKAVVQLKDPSRSESDMEASILVWCRKSLAAYKVPRSVDFRAELPRFPTGKLYKRLLRDEYWKGRERAI